MITRSALPIRKAASSADPDFTVFSSAPAAAEPGSAPKPPRITLKNDRFIALHMYDRIAPEEPTSEPAMISIGLLSEKPIPAAAQPE